jgi:Rod binding domain-containing protein
MSVDALSLSQRSPLDLVGQPPSLDDKGAKDAKAAHQFEGMLMANLFQCLRKTVNHSNLFGNSGSAQNTYEYMLDQAVVNHALEGGKTWGLSDRLQASWDLASSRKKVHGDGEQDLISGKELPIPST